MTNDGPKKLVAASLALRRHQHQPWTLACHFRLRGATEGVQNSDHAGVSRHNSQRDRSDYGEAEHERNKERNHVSTNPYERNIRCVWCGLRIAAF
jgi:hypothetical protein